jgi:hypothetical protein
MASIRILLLGVSVLVGAAATAEASPLTLYFSGSVDLSGSGLAAVNPFSGFFTWDPARTPSETDPGVAIYEVEAYQLIFNGVDRTLGAGLFVFDDVDAFGTGNVDALMFGSVIQEDVTVDGVTGDMFLVAAFSGPTSAWSGTSLPPDYNFLSVLTTSFSAVSLEVAFEGDTNDVLLGAGSLAVKTVPEPASLMLTVLGLTGVVACGRRGRQRA